jgi:hypothetical protein
MKIFDIHKLSLLLAVTGGTRIEKRFCLECRSRPDSRRGPNARKRVALRSAAAVRPLLLRDSSLTPRLPDRVVTRRLLDLVYTASNPVMFQAPDLQRCTPSNS